MRAAIALLLMPVARYAPWFVLRALETRQQRRERREWKKVKPW